MAEKLTDREHSRRVSEARRLLEEPLLIEAFDKIERQAIEELVKAERKDDDGRRLMADYIRAVRAVRRHIEQIIVTGEDALRPPRKVA